MDIVFGLLAGAAIGLIVYFLFELFIDLTSHK